MEVKMRRDVIIFGGHSLHNEYVFSYRGDVRLLFSNFTVSLYHSHLYISFLHASIGI